MGPVTGVRNADRLRILDITLETHVVSDLSIDWKLVMHEAGYVMLEHTTRPRPIIDDLVPQPLQLRLRVFVKHDARKIVDRNAARPANRARSPAPEIADRAFGGSAAPPEWRILSRCRRQSRLRCRGNSMRSQPQHQRALEQLDGGAFTQPDRRRRNRRRRANGASSK